MRLRYTLLLTLSVLLFLLPASGIQAQTDKPSPEKIARYKAVRMSRQLELPDRTADAFIPVYQSFQQEMNAIMQRATRNRARSATTDEQAEAVIRSDFQTSRAILDLRERYYERFKQVITPLQIQQMYSLEKRNAENAARKIQE